MLSLFTYPVSGTQWLVVITDDSGHYYYNKDSKSSVWQLSDTNISDFSSRVDFNELAVLIGRANGLHIHKQETNETPPTKRQRTFESSYHSSIGTSLIESEEDVVVKDAIDGVTNDMAYTDTAEYATRSDISEPKAEVKKVIELEGNIIDIGYSSYDSEVSDNESFISDQTQYAIDDLTSENEHDIDTNDINAGLNLSLSDDNLSSMSGDEHNEEILKNFFLLLDELSSEFSIYDPWFVVEELLLPKVITRPEYYEVPETQREELYNKWAMEKQNKRKAKLVNNRILMDGTLTNEALPPLADFTQQSKYPSKTQLYFRYLLQHKAEIKRLHYPEFYSSHKKELDDLISELSISRADELYRKLRVTLTDVAKNEKEMRKSGRHEKGKADNAESGDKNFKVAHVKSFLEKANLDKGGKCLAHDAGSSMFDHWVQICNYYQVPTKIADSPTNFILGDEKRLQCFKDYFNLT